MKLLASLFAVLELLARLWAERKLRDEGRQQARLEAKEAHDVRVGQAEQIDLVVDPALDERLRTRFDRSRRSE